jgi:hypothetical protein
MVTYMFTSDIGGENYSLISDDGQRFNFHKYDGALLAMMFDSEFGDDDEDYDRDSWKGGEENG